MLQQYKPSKRDQEGFFEQAIIELNLEGLGNNSLRKSREGIPDRAESMCKGPKGEEEIYLKEMREVHQS